MAGGFSAVSLISYDCEFLLQSIPIYLKEMDEVILGLDRNRLTWAGNKIEVPDSFFSTIAALDVDKKIRIIEEDFYVPGYTAIDLDTRERNILSKAVKPNNWIISLDADEMLLNLPEVLQYLTNLEEQNVCVLGEWIIVFKRLANSSLVISSKTDGTLGVFPIATRAQDSYSCCRFTEQTRVLSPALALHYAYGRTEEALYTKLNNWGHNVDFAVDSYHAFWKALDEHNYRYVRNFHPFEYPEWVELINIPEQSIPSVTKKDLLPTSLNEAASVRKFAKAFLRKHIGKSFTF